MRYAELAEVYEKLTSTTKRLEKTYHLSEFMKRIPETDFDHVLLLVQGRIFPAWDQRDIGMANQLVLKAMNLATGVDLVTIEKRFKKTGDLGLTTFELMKTKTQATLFSQALSTKKVFDNLRKLATLEGAGMVQAKTQLVAELLTSATPIEAQYLVRTVLQDLRIGLGEGTMRDAIVWAFFLEDTGCHYDATKKTLVIPENRDKYAMYSAAVQDAINLTNDFSSVARTAKKKGLAGLKNIELNSETPIKVMLYPKAKGIEDAFEIVGSPAAFEYKYDGFRIQIHKKGKNVMLFTRSLENVTEQFPEVVKLVLDKVKGDEFILDGEAVGFDKATSKYVPFQSISQRIKRKYDIAALAAKIPVEVNLFDVISYEGKDLLLTPFNERRVLLKSLVAKPEIHKLKLAEQIITDSVKEAEKFYKQSLATGNEGIMVKSLSGQYIPGARVGQGVKVKPVMDTLEVAVVGAEWGEGKRGKWLATFVIAVRDADTGELMEIGRVGTGFKEKEEEAVDGGVTFQKMTDLLKPLVDGTDGRVVSVRPKIVIEVNYEEIQASPTYSSGYALRFPRFVKLREDRGPDDVSTLADVEQLYSGQRGRS